MQAVVIDDGQLRWEERPDPQVGDHDLLVAVRAAGVNGADLVQRGGLYPAPPGWPPDIPGLEMAGDVLGVGPRVTKFAPDHRVMALVGGGAQATLATVDEAHALAVPEACRGLRPAASWRSSRPPSTRSSARRASRSASAFWSRERPAASVRRPCSSRRWLGPTSSPRCATAPGTRRSPRSAPPRSSSPPRSPPVAPTTSCSSLSAPPACRPLWKAWRRPGGSS